jgi:hypothetical protein
MLTLNSSEHLWSIPTPHDLLFLCSAGHRVLVYLIFMLLVFYPLLIQSDLTMCIVLFHELGIELFEIAHESLTVQTILLCKFQCQQAQDIHLFLILVFLLLFCFFK